MTSYMYRAIESPASAAGPPATCLGPEKIQDGLASIEYSRYCQTSTPPVTSIDVLEISKNSEPYSQWHGDLNHDELLHRFKDLDDLVHTADKPSVLVIFINAKITPGGNHILLASPSSLEWIRQKFHVSLAFLDSVIGWREMPGNACYDRYDSSGAIVRIDALYAHIGDAGPCRVWVSHHQSSQVVTYIVSFCPFKAKLRMRQCAASSECHILLRPMIVDTFIADASAEELKAEKHKLRERLLKYEFHGASQISSESLQNTFQDLHQLSQRWHLLHVNLLDLEEKLTFILDLHRNRIDHKSDFNIGWPMPNYHAMEYLLARTQQWKRWAASYNSRTQVQINLFFNLASQSDNRINIEIAKNSKQIAEATLRDSSSMITIAAMTMLFLPGTFVSAIFSMTFFSNSADTSGNPTLKVLPQWWYFPVATVPLTALVFGCWRLWQRQREGRKAHLDFGAFTSFWKTKKYSTRLKGLFTTKAEVSGIDGPQDSFDALRKRGFGFNSAFASESLGPEAELAAGG